MSGFEDRDDPQGRGIDDQDFVSDHDEFISAPCRIDVENGRRQRCALNFTRYGGTNGDREVDVRERRDLLLPDG